MATPNIPGLMLDRAHPLTRGLVGWWPMNEGGGTRLNNLAQPDEYALSAATVSKRVGGVLGNSMEFGTSAYATATVRNLPAGSSLRTLAVWARFPVGATESMVFGYGAAATLWSQINFYTDTSNHLLVQIYGTGMQIDFVQDGKWHFLAGVMTGTTMGTCRVYVDGQYKAGSLTGNDQTLTTTAANLTFGGQPGSPTTFVFSGALANARLYNRALSDAEVAQIYADPLAGALAPSRAARYYTAPTADPPATPTRPLNADRLNNRTFARTWRRGETG